MKALRTILPPVAAVSTIGLFEAYSRSDLLEASPKRAAALGLLMVLGAYMAVGLLGGLAALVVRERKIPPAAQALAISAVPLMTAMTVSKSGISGKTLAYAALSVVVWRALAALLTRVKELHDPAPWWTLHALGLGLCVVTLSTDALTIAAVVAAGAFLLASLKLPAVSRIGANVCLVVAVVVVATHDPPPAPDVAPPEGAPSILLVSIDTLRADFLGAYGRKEAKTPNLDRLAEEGVRFDNAISHHIYTGPSHLSMLTGLLPENHGVIVNMLKMSGEHQTLADWLRRRGWLTSAFVGGLLVQDVAIGVGDRFHHFDDDFRVHRFVPSSVAYVSLLAFLRDYLERSYSAGLPRRGAEEVSRHAVEWFERAKDQPFFTFVHYYDPHLPYDPPERLLSREVRAYRGPADGRWYELKPGERRHIVEDSASMRHMAALYDAQITRVDEQLAHVFAAAREAAPNGLLIIVTADHGESFGEHGIYFARSLYEPTIHVPMIVSPPEPPAVHEVKGQVRLVDLAPTILDVTGVSIETPLDGKSVMPLVRGSTTAGTGPAFSMKQDFDDEAFQPEYAVRTDDGYKLFRRDAGWISNDKWSGPNGELYDLNADPDELLNLIDLRPELRDELDELLAPHALEGGFSQPELSDQDIARLRSLGYVD